MVSHSDSSAETSRGYFSTNSTTNNNHPDVHEPSAVKILLQVQKPLEKIFNHYKAGKKGLSYDQLCHFLFEFEIFPSFISKSTLYVYFQKRAKASSQLKKVVGQISLDIIGFLEVLADIGYELGDSLTEEEKMLFLLERMQDSQGHRSLLGSEGTNLIGDLRSKYADVYKQNLVKRSPRKEKGFEQLIEDLI